MRAQQKPQYAPTQQRLTKFLPWLVLAIIIAVTAVIRFRLLDVPLERDEGEYAYAGQLMLQGIPPYSLAYNMKMPGIYAAYALLLALFGQTQTGIHLGLLLVNAATTVLVFLLVKYLTDSFTAVFAAAAFAVMSLAPSVQGIFANAEHFVVLFAVAGILLLLHAIDRNNTTLLLVASVLLGIGFLMKQHGAAFVAFAGLYLLFSQLRRKPFLFKPLLLRVALFATGAALPFGLTCLILWRAGVFDKFWFWAFIYAREYVSILPFQAALAILKPQITKIAASAVFIWILSGIGLLTLFLSRKLRPHRVFVLGLALFSFLSTCPGFYFRDHYFVLLLPAIALLSALGLLGVRQALKRPTSAPKKQLIIVFLAPAVLLYSLYQQRHCLLAGNLELLSRAIYPSNPFPESLKIAEYIRANSSSDDTIAVLGSEPQIFFYARRRSASAYIYVFPLMEPQPYALQMQKEMIEQVTQAKPKFLLFVDMPASWFPRRTSNKLIFDWFEQYHPQYYRLVGLADFVSADHVDYYWDHDAANYPSHVASGVYIFRRN